MILNVQPNALATFQLRWLSARGPSFAAEHNCSMNAIKYRVPSLLVNEEHATPNKSLTGITYTLAISLSSKCTHGMFFVAIWKFLFCSLSSSSTNTEFMRSCAVNPNQSDCATRSSRLLLLSVSITFQQFCQLFCFVVFQLQVLHDSKPTLEQLQQTTFGARSDCGQQVGIDPAVGQTKQNTISTRDHLS